MLESHLEKVVCKGFNRFSLIFHFISETENRLRFSESTLYLVGSIELLFDLCENPVGGGPTHSPFPFLKFKK